VFGPGAWLIPQRHWHTVARRLAGMRKRWATPDQAEQCACLYEQDLQVLSEYRPGGWHADLRVEGLEPLESALGAGRGAILWVAPWTFASLVTKKALHAAGHPFTHLSRRVHGPSKSRLGVRLLNPIWSSREKPYLKQRLMLEGSEVAAMRKLERLLRAGELVSIAFLPWAQRSLERTAPWGTYHLPTGPAALSLATGAALIPAFGARRGTTGFDVVLEPPLRPAPGLARRPAVEELVHRYGERLETHAMRDPPAYRWEFLEAVRWER
jgi:lauroyl/myristoyl acyltransferase